MGKKRKKSPRANVASEPPAATAVAEPEAKSQPALSEETAAALVAEAANEPEPAPVAEAQSTEPASEPAAEEIPEVEPDPEPEPEPAAEPAAVAAAAEAAPTSELPETVRPKKKIKKKKKKHAAKTGPTREALDEKIDRLHAKLEVKKEEAAKAAREGFGSNPAIDDTSVPPVDLEIHDEFFAAGERAHLPKEASGAYTALDARHAQKMTAQARARRAHLSRYVMWAVGAAAGILVLGLSVKTMRGHRSDAPVRHQTTYVTQAAEQPAPPPPQKVAPPPQQPVAPPAEEVKKDEPKTDETNAAAPDKTAASPDKSAAAAQPPPETMPAEKPKTAWQEKQTAKAALERGANGAAVAAGERSVALDATDAEAWLVLGAAYQAMGNVGQAKRAFHSCVAHGRKGPVSDCRDMLNSL
jgi:hypothetical protein